MKRNFPWYTSPNKRSSENSDKPMFDISDGPISDRPISKISDKAFLQMIRQMTVSDLVLDLPYILERIINVCTSTEWGESGPDLDHFRTVYNIQIFESLNSPEELAIYILEHDPNLPRARALSLEPESKSQSRDGLQAINVTVLREKKVSQSFLRSVEFNLRQFSAWIAVRSEITVSEYDDFISYDSHETMDYNGHKIYIHCSENKCATIVFPIIVYKTKTIFRNFLDHVLTQKFKYLEIEINDIMPKLENSDFDDAPADPTQRLKYAKRSSNEGKPKLSNPDPDPNPRTHTVEIKYCPNTNARLMKDYEWPLYDNHERIIHEGHKIRIHYTLLHDGYKAYIHCTVIYEMNAPDHCTSNFFIQGLINRFLTRAIRFET